MKSFLLILLSLTLCTTVVDAKSKRKKRKAYAKKTYSKARTAKKLRSKKKRKKKSNWSLFYLNDSSPHIQRLQENKERMGTFNLFVLGYRFYKSYKIEVTQPLFVRYPFEDEKESVGFEGIQGHFKVALADGGSFFLPGFTYFGNLGVLLPTGDGAEQQTMVSGLESDLWLTKKLSKNWAYKHRTTWHYFVQEQTGYLDDEGRPRANTVFDMANTFGLQYKILPWLRFRPSVKWTSDWTYAVISEDIPADRSDRLGLKTNLEFVVSSFTFFSGIKSKVNLSRGEDQFYQEENTYLNFGLKAYF